MRKWLFICAIVLLPPIWGQNKEQESFGIDVSHHKGKFKWKQVSDVEFVYVKATKVATYVDSLYQQNIKGARAKKLLVGTYHYFRTTSQYKNNSRTISNTLRRKI